MQMRVDELVGRGMTLFNIGSMGGTFVVPSAFLPQGIMGWVRRRR